MKKIILSFITVMVFAQACSQTEEEMTAAFANDTETVDNPLTPLLDAMSLTDFKEDFISYSPVKKPLNANTCPLLFKHRKSLYLEDKTMLLNAYASMKSDMVYYHNQDVLYHATDFQHLALRMLRFHFLPDNSKFAIEETQFLLNMLIESGAVDLDVLADAYVRVRQSLTDEQKVDYMNYFQKLYYKDKNYIADNFEVFKKGYETSTGIKRKEFLYNGRYLVNKARTLRYANDLLQIETEQKN